MERPFVYELYIKANWRVSGDLMRSDKQIPGYSDENEDELKVNNESLCGLEFGQYHWRFWKVPE